MTKTAIVLLLLTAAGGLVMAVLRFTVKDRPPSWLAMLHGVLAAGALTLLLYAGFTAGLPAGVWLGTVLLIAAALGGVYLNLAYHTKLRPLPKSIVVVHGVLAVAGTALLVTSGGLA